MGSSSMVEEEQYIWHFVISTLYLLLLRKAWPVNSIPALMLLIQILAFMHYFSYSGPNNKQLFEVATLYYLGMAGHFALGNSNTLATIDVDGAFIVLSSSQVILILFLKFHNYLTPSTPCYQCSKKNIRY